MSLSPSFKKHLEQLCGIAAWSPTTTQLEEIAGRIKTEGAQDVAAVQEIVHAVYPGATYLMLEGVDNSDVRTLLALAIAAAKG